MSYWSDPMADPVFRDYVNKKAAAGTSPAKPFAQPLQSTLDRAHTTQLDPNAPRPPNPFTDMPVPGGPAIPTATPNQPNPLMGMLGSAKGGGATAVPAIPLTPDGRSQTAASGLGAQPQPTSGGLGGGKGGALSPVPDPNSPFSSSEISSTGVPYNQMAMSQDWNSSSVKNPQDRKFLGLPPLGQNPDGTVDAQPQLPMAEGLNVNPPQQPQLPMANSSQLQQTPQQPGFNVNQAAAGSLQGAIGATQQAMQGPLNVGAYANPFTSAVIDRTQQDIARQQEMATNTMGAQATAANAFGGSRHGVAEGVMAGEYGRMSGDIAAQQRQANYSQALQAAMNDRTSRLGAASQLGGLGQQAFNTGQTIQGNQQQQGLLQQGIQQALIDAARQQYAGYTGAPTTALQAPLAALGVTPTPQTTTNSMQPGLFNYLQLGAGMMK